MKIFKDSELKQELEGDKFELGVVQAGDSQRYNFYIYNETDSELKDLKFRIMYATEELRQEKELKIISSPSSLSSKQSGKVVIEYSPILTLEQSLLVRLVINAGKLAPIPKEPETWLEEIE